MTTKRWMDALKKTFLKECGEDFVGLWAILWKVRHLRPRIDADEARRATLEIVQWLLASGQVIAGHPTEDSKFVPWKETPGEALERIEREWTALGREPNLGDIVWFVQRDVVCLADTTQASSR
jgi:hypothetical protein